MCLVVFSCFGSSVFGFSGVFRCSSWLVWENDVCSRFVNLVGEIMMCFSEVI